MKQPFPGRISSVVMQQKMRPGLGRRVNVFINDRFSFALDAGLAMDRGLRPGLELDQAALDELIGADGNARAYARALSFLGYRARSAKEITDRLARDEWPDTVIARVIEKLRGDGLVDDAAFSAQWVDSRARKRGGRALTQELRLKGVDRETIEASLPDADEEASNAREAARRKWENWSALEARERREKTLQFLQRRGFGFGVALSAVKALESGE
ncbi:MAG TPA: RecX family transcriptional regulator [Abditibacteriaceae bacterium]|jgi:regulatory protein